MTEEALRFLLSSEGESAVWEASTLTDPLMALERLRRHYTPEQASAAFSLADLRKRGASKFTRADRMLFTRDALEMATGETIARWRARRFEGYGLISDLTCGIGGDALSLAKNATVIAVDHDPLSLRMAQRNAAVYEVEDRFLPVCADAREWRPPVSALWIDPSRRKEGRRLRHGEKLSPPLPEALEWARSVKAAGIKLSPAFDWEPYAGEAEVELISDGGECREAVLWLGEAKTCRVRASLADQGVSLVERETDEIPVRPIGRYLYEPDAAVRRAHLINVLAEDMSAWKLDLEIAYLSSDRLTPTPFAAAYAVIDAFPFSLKELQRRLRSRGAGKVIVKKRGVAYDPAEIEKRLKLDGDATFTVVLTRLRDRPSAFIVTPVTAESAPHSAD